MSTHEIHGIFTILLIITFSGMCFWVFSKNRNKDFEEAARLPLDDE
jgi:cytochrome c oxidase cbb3-type subunit 4